MTPAAIKPLVHASVLEQIDVRVGTIVRVDELPSSRKLVNADGITPVLAVPEARVPNGARAG